MSSENALLQSLAIQVREGGQLGWDFYLAALESFLTTGNFSDAAIFAAVKAYSGIPPEQVSRARELTFKSAEAALGVPDNLTDRPIAEGTLWALLNAYEANGLDNSDRPKYAEIWRDAAIAFADAGRTGSVQFIAHEVRWDAAIPFEENPIRMAVRAVRNHIRATQRTEQPNC